MHEDACEVQLHLEPHVNIGPVDGGRPPQCETTVWNLVETRTLCVGQFLVFHGLLKSTGLLPERMMKEFNYHSQLLK